MKKQENSLEDAFIKLVDNRPEYTEKEIRKMQYDKEIEELRKEEAEKKERKEFRKQAIKEEKERKKASKVEKNKKKKENKEEGGNITIFEMKKADTTLEDAFMKLIEGGNK